MGELEDVVLVPQRITKPLQCPCCEMAYTSITVECSSIGEDEGVDGEWEGCGSSATKDYIACPCCKMAYTSVTVECSSIGEDEGMDEEWEDMVLAPQRIT